MERSSPAADFNAFDNDPWIVRTVDFVKAVLAQDRVRFIGVCWGHQILGRALGAKVARSEGGGWEVSVCQVNNSARGKELFGKDALVSGLRCAAKQKVRCARTDAEYR